MYEFMLADPAPWRLLLRTQDMAMMLPPAPPLGLPVLAVPPPCKGWPDDGAWHASLPTKAVWAWEAPSLRQSESSMVPSLLCCSFEEHQLSCGLNHCGARLASPSRTRATSTPPPLTARTYP